MNNLPTNTDESWVNGPVDISNCDREPIHIPGAIQPFGFLIGLLEEGMQVVLVSENIYSYTGVQASLLLEMGLSVLLTTRQLEQIRTSFNSLTERNKWLPLQLIQVSAQPNFMAVLHRHDGLLWIEFEPQKDEETKSFSLSFLNSTVSHMLKTSSLQHCCQLLADSVRSITGFDRVVVYRFKEDQSGQVIAEAKSEDLETWVDLHYPASDIPRQARELYLKNWLRFIPDVSYTPVSLVTAPGFRQGNPPDMTYAILRSVSPIHLEYLQNMGVGASMSISLVQEEKLWGLVACHHQTPRLLANEGRNLCEFMGCTFSALLKDKEYAQDQTYRLHIRDIQARLLDQLKGKEDFKQALFNSAPLIRQLLECGGAAVCFEQEIVSVGAIPDEEEIRKITAWLQQQTHQDVFFTNCYGQHQHHPDGSSLTETCSGLLAISLSQAQGDYLLWFRPEVIRTVTWAGQPQKAVTFKEGEMRLSPRHSFEAWKELVQGNSQPWKPVEIEAAAQVRYLLMDILLKVSDELKLRAAILAKLNLELERSNTELDSFAYIASHDLKEPLRGIHNYSVFLLEDYEGKFDEEGEDKLKTLVRLSKRMESLIDSLLQFSRLGRVDLAIGQTDINQTVAEVLDMLRPRLEQTHATVHLLTPLPVLLCDRVRVSEVFINLIANAVKYNDKPEKIIKIGVLTENEVKKQGKYIAGRQPCYVFFVRDNGIGIDEKHHEVVFKLFKRLHTQEKYGGGTGAGLTIVKKIIEKHGGDIWIDSVKGEGTTFYFTLQPKG